MEDVDVHVGETTQLAVVVEGKPDPDILWFKVLYSKLKEHLSQFKGDEHELIFLLLFLRMISSSLRAATSSLCTTTLNIPL